MAIHATLVNPLKQGICAYRLDWHAYCLGWKDIAVGCESAAKPVWLSGAHTLLGMTGRSQAPWARPGWPVPR
jgi:hypothetical protein